MILPTEVIFGLRPPPAKLKVYAPSGDTKVVTAYLGLRTHVQNSQLIELYLQYEDGTAEVLNKMVVVQNLETGEVCHDPRTAHLNIAGRVFISESEVSWLQKNPHWPAILELRDHPVDDSGGGLNP